MTNQEKHYMAILIENCLYDILKEIEASGGNDKDKLRDDIINSFIEEYKNTFPDVTYEEFKSHISFVLNRTKQNEEEVKKNRKQYYDEG